MKFNRESHNKAVDVGEKLARELLNDHDPRVAAAARVSLKTVRANMDAMFEEFERDQSADAVLIAFQPVFANLISTVLVNSTVPPEQVGQILLDYMGVVAQEAGARYLMAMGIMPSPDGRFNQPVMIDDPGPGKRGPVQ